MLSITTLLSAATIKVTNNLPTGDGSLAAAITAAATGDVIVFEFTGSNTIILSAQITMKNITINGLNSLTGSNVILKQSIDGDRIFAVNSNTTASLSNLIFDGYNGSVKQAFSQALPSTLNIDNCIFRNFVAKVGDNGGIGRIQGILNITNSLFINNTCAGTYGGGALCIYNASNVTIDNCSFIGNSSNTPATTSEIWGGGAIVVRGTSAGQCSVKITNSTFANNVTTSRGGAIFVSVQSATTPSPVDLTVINCTIAGNQGDGAISTHTTSIGAVHAYLVNSIVTNNVDAAASGYFDLMEFKGTDAATVASIEPHNVIYSAASSTIVTTGSNSVKVNDPSTAVIFKELETYATNKKRPVLSTSNGQTVAMISSSSIAKNAGVSTLAGYTIPILDQLSETRPSTPAVGAVEYKQFTNITEANIIKPLNIIVRGKEITVVGLSNKSEMFVYGLSGNLLRRSVVSNNETISLNNIHENLVIVKVQNQSLKVLLK